MAVKTTVTGVKEAKRILSKLPARVSKGVFIKAFRAGSRPAIAAMRKEAPVSKRTDTGHPAANLRRSIRLVASRGRRWPTVWIGPSMGAKYRFDAYYARWVVGGAKAPPDPFVEQGWASSKGQALAAIKVSMETETRKIIAKYTR